MTITSLRNSLWIKTEGCIEDYPAAGEAARTGAQCSKKAEMKKSRHKKVPASDK